MQESITGGFRKLREDLSRMTFRQKLDHLWTYYKSVLLVALLVIVLLSLIFNFIIFRSTDLIIAGVSVNIPLSDTAVSYIEDGYYERHAKGGLEKVLYADMRLGDFLNETFQDDIYAVTTLTGMAQSKQLDFMIMNEAAFTFIVKEQVFLDLRELFSDEELTAMGANVIYAQNEEQTEPIPLVLNIADSAFAQNNTQEKEKVYLGFTANSPRIDRCRDFYEYLLAWQP